MKKHNFGGARVGGALALSLFLSACDGGSPLSNMFGGDKPADGVVDTLPRPNPDSRGVITYASYQVMVARSGDTVASMAQRVNLDPVELARHNGLPSSYRPRPGEQLALPRNVGGTPATVAPGGGIWSTDIAASAIDAAPATGTAPAGPGISAAPSATIADNPFRNGQPSPVIDPLRHRVQAGETAYSVARLYGVPVKAIGEWNGLDANFSVRTNQELLIPVFDNRKSRPQPAAPAVASLGNAPGTATPITPPPSAQTPLPENQDIAAVTPPPSPALATPARSSRLSLPVASASVLRGYAPNGPQKNEGVDFAAAAGSPVMAAADGEIALISKSLGGLGTIVLIRHDDNLMTVYGRVTGVTLQKGASVTRGQKIGIVADGDPANVHFEVRRGTESVDPTGFLPG